MEEMLAARGISVTHETIGKGALKIGSDSGEQSGGWLALDAALTQADMTHEGHIYKGVNHGFHNDATPQYDEAAAKEAWQRMEQAATSGGQEPALAKAGVEWHPSELCPRIGFIVTNLARLAERVVAFYNHRGTCEQYIKEGKGAIKWTRLSRRSFAANAVRLQLHVLASNLSNFMRTLRCRKPRSRGR
jgi:Transposase DDE domain group 1/Dienelactone hydrolase family